MYDIIFNRISFIKNGSEELKIQFLYRYLSLFVTTIFYFISDLNYSIENKIFVVVCISISSIILTYLYMKNENSKKNIGLLVFIETIGNCFILIPIGGLNSPYVWYAFNTILITSIKLNKKYCWINLSIYLFVPTGIFYFALNKGKVILMDLINEESNLIICFILITVAIQLLTKFIKKIQMERKNLIEANKKIKESMEHTMSLYQAVHSFTNKKNKNELMKLLIHYTKEITKVDTVFFYGMLQEKNKIFIEGNKSSSEIFEDQIVDRMNNIINCEIPIEEISVENKRFILAVVKSTYKTYGILGIETTASNKDLVYKENIDQLRFLSELSSIVLENSYLEEVNERLLITEEQNRIANEIHDSVLQRLFSMSCGTFALMRNLEKVSNHRIQEELNTIRNSTDHAIKELRETIYGRSWKKDGRNTFEEDIYIYIDEIKRLNNAGISFNILGNHELLSWEHKKAFYRIICEGIGNGLRHGKASGIKITLDIKPQWSVLEIMDNGTGFQFNEIKNDKQNGLGLRNIHYLAYSLKGEMDIDSEIGKGTTIKVKIPNGIQTIEKEEAV